MTFVDVFHSIDDIEKEGFFGYILQLQSVQFHRIGPIIISLVLIRSFVPLVKSFCSLVFSDILHEIREL